MSDGLTDRRRTGAIERHAQTIIAGIVAAVLGWVAVTLLDLKDKTVRLEENVRTLTKSVDEVQTQIKAIDRARYTDSDARRDFGGIHELLVDHERRLRAVEDKRRGLR